jgi:hypothetical protein
MNKQVHNAALMLGLTCIATGAHAATNVDDFTQFAGFGLSGEQNFSDVGRTFGEAPVVTEEVNGNLAMSMCYKTDGGYVRFLSSELAGKDHTVMGFAVSSKEPNSKCVTLAADKAPATPFNVGGLTLGMSMYDYKAVVQDRTSTGSELLSAVYSTKVTYPSGAQANAQVYIVPEFASRRLEGFQVWKTITR